VRKVRRLSPVLVTHLATLTDGRVVCLDPFVASANLSTAHAGQKMTNLAWLAKSASNSKMRSKWARSGSPNYGLHITFVTDEK